MSSKFLSECVYQINQLMESKCLQDPEQLLSDEYFLCAQPALERCIIITQESCTYIISVKGKLLTKAETYLPNHELSSPCTILEGYYSNYAEIFIQDVLLWDTEDFRSHSARDRFAFIARQLCSLTPSALKFTPIDFFSCTHENILKLYEEKNIQALLFYKAKGCYESAFSSNKLMWYDCSFQSNERDRNCKLECMADGSLCTAEGLIAYRLSENEALRLEIYTGKIVQCCVGECEAFKIKSVLSFSASSGRATSWTCIFFDWKLRKNLISVDRFAEVMNSMDICDISDSQDSISEFLNYEGINNNIPIDGVFQRKCSSEAFDDYFEESQTETLENFKIMIF